MGIENGVTHEWERKRDRMEILREQGLVSFDVALTPEEKRVIAEVNFKKELPQFDYYGSVNEELVRNLIVYLSGLGENSPEIVRTLSHLVARVAEIVSNDLGKESAWVMVRTSLPHEDFTIPRWHPDGKYFDSGDETYKLVMTIKGALTRFGEVKDPDVFEEIMKEISHNHDLHPNDPEAFEREDLRLRKKLDAVVKEIHPSQQGEAVYYLVGSHDAKIHSEPKIDEPRIFMSVVAGSTEQINQLRQRWSKTN